MLTREGTITGILAAVIFLLATNLASGLMFVLDALLVSLLAVGAVTAVAPLRTLSARRVAPDRVTEGAEVQIEVSVITGVRVDAETNVPPRRSVARRSPGPRLWSIEDGWDGARGRSVVPVSSDTQPVVGVVVVEAGRRGRARLGPIVIGSRGALGLISARRRLSVPGETMVWPRVYPLAGAVLARFAVDGDGLEARRARHAADLHGLRDYRPGDALRRIHWRSSIRRGTPVVREFEQPVTPGITIVIDLDRRQHPTRLDSAVRATAALLHHFMIVQRRPVTLIGWSETLVQWHAWEPAMDWLATVTPSGPPVGTVLAALTGETRDALVVASTASVAASHGATVVAPVMDLAGTAPLRGHLTYDADGRVSVW
jgi:uncharacterized protein (DUF58 family)